jgi:hypothetical protein
VPADEAFDPVRILTVLEAHAVEYLLVGGFAAQAHGALRQTRDIDLVPSTTEENLGRTSPTTSKESSSASPRSRTSSPRRSTPAGRRTWRRSQSSDCCSTRSERRAVTTSSERSGRVHGLIY